MLTRILLILLTIVSFAIIILLCRVDIVDTNGNVIEKKRAFFFTEKVVVNNNIIPTVVHPMIIDTGNVTPPPPPPPSPMIHGKVIGSSVKLKDKCSFDFTVNLITYLNINTPVIFLESSKADTTNWRFIKNGCLDIYKKKIDAGKAVKIIKKIGEDSFKIQYKEGDMITSTDISKAYLEKIEPLHYRIRISNGQEGWVSAKYISLVR